MAKVLAAQIIGPRKRLINNARIARNAETTQPNLATSMGIPFRIPNPQIPARIETISQHKAEEPVANSTEVLEVFIWDFR